MKKFLTVLLVIAVMFTFSFGSAFAATLTSDDVKDIKNDLRDESARLQTAIEKVGSTYMENVVYDNDGYILRTSNRDLKSANKDGLFTKAVLQARVEGAVDDAQIAISDAATYLQNQLVAGTTDTSSAVQLSNLANLYSAICDIFLSDDYIMDAREVADTLKTAGTIAWESQDATATYAKIAEKQYKADRDAAKDALNTYAADANKYSDNLDDKTYSKDTNLAENPTGGPSTVKSYIVGTITAETKDQTAKDFVKNFTDHQLDVIDEIDDKTPDTAGYTYLDSITKIADIRTMADDIMLGHKAGTDADENYYVEAVPTKDSASANTELPDKKVRAIREIKAQLNAKAVQIETALNDALTTEQKKSKPDNQVVKDLKENLADLDGQVTAAEEVYTALINYCDTKDEVDTVKNEILTKIRNMDVPTGATPKAVNDSFESGAQVELKKNKNISDNVADLKEEAALLKIQKDVNGKPLYDAEVLDENLDDQIEVLYKGNGTKSQLDDAKEALKGGSEVALVNAKYNHVEYINGNEVKYTNGDKVSYFTPEDKNGKAITDTNKAGKKAWNKEDATRKVTSKETVVAMNADGQAEYVVNEVNDVVDLYDDAQQEALKALVKETEDAIKAAKTVNEVKDIFAAAQAKYEDIKTTEDHFSDWSASKPIGRKYKDDEYDKQLVAYINYVDSKVDFSDDYYGVTKAALLEKARDIMYEAYTKDELATKFDEAKAMVDSIKTKTQVKADKKAVEDLIAAIPATVTLADKDAITKAADALDDYEDLIGTTNPSVTNTAKLEAAKTDYEKLAADELDDAYRALKNKTITVEDQDAIKALRDLYDAHDDFCSDYDVTSTATTSDDQVTALENDLDKALVRYAKELMIKIPANPTAKDKAQVEAARAYYEGLELKNQKEVVDSMAYKNLIDAEEALGLNIDKSVKELKITAKSVAKKGSITVSWTVKGDATAADGYQIWKSTKHSKGYKKAFTTKKQTYKNTKGLKKGTRYYYKVRAYKVVDGKNVYSDWSNKARRIAK